MHTDISPRKPKNPGLLKACRLAGGQKALATRLGRKQGTVWEWLFVSGTVPASVCMQIEDETGVPAEAINDDLAAFAKRRGIAVRRLNQGRAAA